jgi:hypothetical protein
MTVTIKKSEPAPPSVETGNRILGVWACRRWCGGMGRHRRIWVDSALRHQLRNTGQTAWCCRPLWLLRGNNADTGAQGARYDSRLGRV